MFTVTENQVVNYQSTSQSTSALVEEYLLDYWKLDRVNINLVST